MANEIVSKSCIGSEGARKSVGKGKTVGIDVRRIMKKKKRNTIGIRANRVKNSRIVNNTSRHNNRDKKDINKHSKEKKNTDKKHKGIAISISAAKCIETYN